MKEAADAAKAARKAKKGAKKANRRKAMGEGAAPPTGTPPERVGFRESRKSKPVELVEDAEHTYAKDQFDFKQCAVGEQAPFTCARCLKEKKSRNKIVFLASMKVICNGCYGCILSPTFKATKA